MEWINYSIGDITNMVDDHGIREHSDAILLAIDPPYILRRIIIGYPWICWPVSLQIPFTQLLTKLLNLERHKKRMSIFGDYHTLAV